MSKVIAVTSGKGGTGKSSICACLGYTLAKKGYRTLIIELDIGLRCLDIMLGMQGCVPYDLGDVIKGDAEIFKATSQVDMAKNLNIICAPSNPFLTITAEQIKDIVDQTKKYYDYIIIDTSAGINENVFRIVSESDLILIVTTPDPVCTRDAQMMSDEFYNRGNQKQRLIINKVNKASLDGKIVTDFDEIIDIVGIQLIGVIPEDKEIVSATSQGRFLSTKSSASLAFNAISNRINGEETPLALNVKN